jgi:hypothetical protein
MVGFDNIAIESRHFPWRSANIRGIGTKLGSLGKKNGAALVRALW